MMAAITSLNLKPVQEIYAMIARERKSLVDLAPYNGTGPGARAITTCRENIDALERELARRASINDPNQED